MMVEVTQEDRDTLDAVTVEWCMGDNNVSLEIIAAYRQASYQRGKLEGARLAIEAAAEVCAEYEQWHNKHDDGLSGFGHMALGSSEVRDNIRALDPAKIVGEG